MALRAYGWTMTVGALLISPVVCAHHSVAAVFDRDDKITLTGTITEVEWVNPHVYLQLEVIGEDGEAVTWAWESLPTRIFLQVGLTEEMLLGDGEPVTIHGIRAHRKEELVGWIYRITYADGHFFQIAGDEL